MCTACSRKGLPCALCAASPSLSRGDFTYQTEFQQQVLDPQAEAIVPQEAAGVGNLLGDDGAAPPKAAGALGQNCSFVASSKLWARGVLPLATRRSVDDWESTPNHLFAHVPFARFSCREAQ